MPNQSAIRQVSRVVCAALATTVLLSITVPVAGATPRKTASIPEVEAGIRNLNYSGTADRVRHTRPTAVAADEEAAVSEEEGVFKLPIKFTLPRDPLITISLRNAAIRDIIQVLAKRGNLNILIDTAAAKERIDLDVREVRLSEALTMVLAIANLRYARVGQTYMVATADSLVRRGFSVFKTKSFHINNASVETIKTKLEEMFEKVGEQAAARITGPSGGFTSTAATPAPAVALGPGGAVTAVPPGSLGAVPAAQPAAQPGQPAGGAGAADILKPKIISDNRTRTVTLIATPDDIKKAEKFIAFLDVPQPQIFIEIKVISMSTTISRQLGTSYGFAAGKVGIGMLNSNPQSTSNGVDSPGNVSSGNFGINFSALGNFTPNFNARLTALLNDSKAKILANPRVAMIVGGDGAAGGAAGGAGGDSATIDLTNSVPVISSQQTTVSTTQSVQFIDIGSKLTIKNVHIDDEHNVVVTIDAEVSDRGKDVILNGNVTPEKVKRSVQTVMRIKDNESLVIGGLISRNQNVAHNRVPLLGEIPILGLLFSESSNNDSESEVMLVVTPHIATEVLNEKTLQINGKRSSFMDEFKDFRPFKDLRSQ